MDVSGMWKSEQLVVCRDEEIGLRAVIAIDDTTLGPGLGGVRLKRYPTDRDALVECRRLAAAMTLKNALAEVPFGGAKAVIVDNGRPAAREELMRRFGEFVKRTGGAYIPGVDMGTTTRDLAVIGAAGVDVSCSEEDPSPWTALGVLAAIRSTVAHVDQRSDLEGLRVLVQGIGHVGTALAGQLAREGALLTVTDIDGPRAAALAGEIGCAVVAPERALATPCDVLAPCATARVVDMATVDRLRCRMLVGAANDMLAHADYAERLAQRGITYLPDFLANAGGVIHIHALRSGWSETQLRDAVLGIGERSREVLEHAERSGISPLAAAGTRALARLGQGRPTPAVAGSVIA